MAKSRRTGPPPPPNNRGEGNGKTTLFITQKDHIKVVHTQGGVVVKQETAPLPQSVIDRRKKEEET